MSKQSRQLRSQSASNPQASASVPKSTGYPPLTFHTSDDNASRHINLFPHGSKLTGLSTADLNFLRRKQKKLQRTAQETLESLPDSPQLLHQRGLASTLIFADYAAGTAVCIAPSGLVLTCAHCVAEPGEQSPRDDTAWLLFYNGLAFQTRCLVVDHHRDLALLRIVVIEAEPTEKGSEAVGVSKQVRQPSFGTVQLSARPPPLNAPIFCIGQPGRDDLESSVARKTTYNLVEVSHGKFRGMIPGADPQDNSEIGSLKHDAWTYWGHSGAPLLRESDGSLIGLHSSCDDQTAMRHGVPLVAIREFLSEVSRSSSSDIRDELDAVLQATVSAKDQGTKPLKDDDTICPVVNLVQGKLRSPPVTGTTGEAAIVIDDN